MKPELNRYTVADLMRNELACIKRAKHCDRQCAACDLVKDDEELIAAYGDVIGALQSPQTPRVTQCCMCDHWDKESGLTARKCAIWGRFTTQHEYCSRAKEVKHDNT